VRSFIKKKRSSWEEKKRRNFRRSVIKRKQWQKQGLYTYTKSLSAFTTLSEEGKGDKGGGSTSRQVGRESTKKKFGGNQIVNLSSGKKEIAKKGGGQMRPDIESPRRKEDSDQSVRKTARRSAQVFSTEVGECQEGEKSRSLFIPVRA